tara:strand:- start:297 stop:1133 length:837 start_codon:yes stop_codon:yes gene_type:complete
MQYQTNKLSKSFGVEVIGVKLHSNMEQKVINEIEELILKNKVVVFRGQDFTPEEQIAFCKQFGETALHPLKQNTCPYNDMTYISNISEKGVNLGYPGPSFPIWHSDLCYEPNPPKFSFLYAEKVPDKGGNTIFANSTLAYEELDADLKEKLKDKLAVFGFSEKLMQRCKDKNYDLVIAKEDQRPDFLHPVFRTHPSTKKKSIFVNWTHTDSIKGFSDKESSKYLDELFKHSTKDRYTYSHNYDKNDLIIWDNSATLHTGDGSIEIDKPRVMRRVVIRY